MWRRIYLSLGLALDLAFQPVAAVLGVPQGLRNGPHLGRDSSFLLHDLLQLQGDLMFSFHPPEVHWTLCLWWFNFILLNGETHHCLPPYCFRESQYLGVDLLEELISLLDLIHAALQVAMEPVPLSLQSTHCLVRFSPTCRDECFLSNGREKKLWNESKVLTKHKLWFFLTFGEKNIVCKRFSCYNIIKSVKLTWAWSLFNLQNKQIFIFTRNIFNFSVFVSMPTQRQQTEHLKPSRCSHCSISSSLGHAFILKWAPGYLLRWGRASKWAIH